MGFTHLDNSKDFPLSDQGQSLDLNFPSTSVIEFERQIPVIFALHEGYYEDHLRVKYPTGCKGVLVISYLGVTSVDGDTTRLPLAFRYTTFPNNLSFPI